MSVPVPVVVREPSSPSATPQSGPGMDASFDARWAAWIERGRHHDLAVKRHLRNALYCAGAVGTLIVILLGLAAGTR